MTAFTPEEFLASEYAVPGRFDSLLSAHVLEHLEWDDAVALVQTYLPFVRRRRQGRDHLSAARPGSAATPRT